MKIIVKPFASILLLCLSFQVGQVLAQKTAKLSVSAIVNGNCSIRQSGDNGYSYSVTCSNGVQGPQALRLLPERERSTRSEDLVRALGNGAISNGAINNTARQPGGVVLVY